MRKIELILKDEKTEETVFATQLFGMDFSDNDQSIFVKLLTFH